MPYVKVLEICTVMHFLGKNKAATIYYGANLFALKNSCRDKNELIKKPFLKVLQICTVMHFLGKNKAATIYYSANLFALKNSCGDKIEIQKWKKYNCPF